MCQEAFHEQESFRHHITKGDHLHKFEFYEPSRLEEFVSYCKRVLPREPSTEECPFCHKAPSMTQKGLARHIGQHQQEIALAALPRLETDEEDSDDDSIDIDSVELDDVKTACNHSLPSSSTEEGVEVSLDQKPGNFAGIHSEIVSQQGN